MVNIMQALKENTTQSLCVSLKSLDLLPASREEQENAKKIYPRACLASGFHPLEKIYTNEKFLVGFLESESGRL